MAVDLHGGDSVLSCQSLADEDYEILHSHISSSIQIENHEEKGEDDFIVELTSNMDAYCMFQSKDKQLDDSSSSSVSDKPDEMSWSSWGFADSLEHKLWSPLNSKHSSGVSSPTDNKDPLGYCSSFDQSYSELNMKFKQISMNEERDSKINKGHGFHLLGSPSTVVSSSNGSPLVDDQIQTLQEELKMKTYWEINAQSLQQSETNQGKLQHYHTDNIVKAIGYRNNRQRVRPGGLSCSGVGTVAGTQLPEQRQKYQPPGLDFNAISLGSSNARSSCGTGVFLPRTIATSSASRKKSGCSTVLIPARVVQALQQHFDQIGVTTAKKAGCLLPLHDVLVHNKDGMYSLQKRYLQRVSTHSQKETSLPQEWTY